MSNPNGNKPAPMATNGGDGKPVIAVKRIVFRGTIDLPEKACASNVPCSRRSDVVGPDGKRVSRGRHYLVEYLPWMRHHRVLYFASGDGEPQERMVHESKVDSWDPA